MHHCEDHEELIQDVAAKVLRQIDWDTFLDRLDNRKRRIVEEMMLGFGTGEIARLFSVSAARVVQLKREVAKDIRSFMGDSILADVGSESVWERDIRCLREKGEWKLLKVERIDADIGDVDDYVRRIAYWPVFSRAPEDAALVAAQVKETVAEKWI